MSTGKVLLGLVAGAAAGAVLGILMAPDKGSETRKQIARKGEALVNNLRTRFEDFLTTASTNLEALKEDAGDLKAKAKEKVRETVDKANDIGQPQNMTSQNG
jgi:gas vesicle protein